MKITIVQGAFLPVPPVRGGAVEKLWYALGVGLSRHGVEVTHISRAEKGQADEEIDGTVRRLRIKGFDWSNFKLLSRFYDLIYSFRVLRKLPNANILVTNTFFLPLLVRAREKGKIYVSVHRFPRKQFRFYSRAARFQCVSNSVAKALAKNNPDCSSRIKVIQNFVEAVTNADSAATGFFMRERKILFVGRIHPEKGIGLLVEAFARLPESLRDQWKIEVVGPHAEDAGGGGEGFFEDMRSFAEKCKVKITWVGPVYDAQRLSEIYASAKLFVYPSLAAQGEAFPLAPLEAMAQGTPVVVSKLECFQDYIIEGKNGWTFEAFAPNPAMALAETLTAAIKRIEFDGAEYARNAIDTAQRFSLDAIVAQFISDFRSLSVNE